MVYHGFSQYSRTGIFTIDILIDGSLQVFILDILNPMDAFEMGSKVVSSGPDFVLVFATTMGTLITTTIRAFFRMDTPLMPFKVVWCTKTLGSSTARYITGERLSMPLPMFSKRGVSRPICGRRGAGVFVRPRLLELRVGLHWLLASLTYNPLAFKGALWLLERLLRGQFPGS